MLLNFKTIRMEREYSPKLIPALIYGGMTGGVLILYTLVIDLLNAQFSTLNSIAMIVLEFLGLFYAMYTYRKEYRGNTISYGQAFAFGTLVALVLSLILVVFNFIYIKWINPDMVQMTRDMMEQKLLEKGASEEMIEKQMQLMDRFKSPVIQLVGGFLGNLFTFSVMNLIIAGFVKREPADPFANLQEDQ